jgi:flavin-dependent dehydrogenase
MERYDVVVVGAGLAGLQCAKLLGRNGLSVLLADARPSLERSIHTTGIFVRKTLEDFDFPASCLGPPVREVILYSPARRGLRLVSRHDEFRIGRMGSLYAHLLEECRSAGVEWSPATRYTGSEGADGDTLLRLEREGQPWWVRCRFLVGADGARSLVAQDLGLDVNREWIVGVEEVLAGCPRQDAPRLHAFLDPIRAPGYLAWVADDGEEVHVGVGGYPARFDPLLALRSFRESLDGLVDLSGGRTIERRGGRIPVGGVLRRIAGPRGLLVGDAAGAPSPLTAGGLDPCMRLSSLAARVVPQYLESGDPAALAIYSGSRFRTRFIARRFMRRSLALASSARFLEAGCTLLRSAAFRPFARHIFFGRGSFPDIIPLPKTRQRLAH